MMHKKYSTRNCPICDKEIHTFIDTIGRLGHTKVHNGESHSRGARMMVGSDDEEINDKWLGRALKRLNLILDKRKMRTGREVRLNYMKAREKLKIFL